MPRQTRLQSSWDGRRIEPSDADWRRLGPARLARMAQQILLIREFEERLLALKDAGLVHGPVHSSIGQEAVAAGAVAVMRGDDLMSSTHRAHHHVLAKAMSAYGEAKEGLPEPGALCATDSRVVRRTLAEILGLAEGWCGGRGGSMHLADADSGILGTNAIVAGGIPLAVGAGWAEARQGTDRASIAFFGDGALNQGAFHEALNLAVLWRCPVVFCVENNLYAVATRVDDAVSSCRVVERSAGYDAPGRVVDGMDPVAVAAAVGLALDRARSGGGPTFLELETYRYRHQAQGLRGSAYGYRTRDEETGWEQRDPAVVFPASLVDREIVTSDQVDAMRDAARGAVAAAVDALVEATDGRRRIRPSAWPARADCLRGLRSDGSEWNGAGFRERDAFSRWENRTCLDVISETLGRCLETDDRVVVLGEEVAGMKGGAFQATRGLPSRFPGRVINTPISEAGFCGLALGAALRGMRPIVEIMYPDFSLVAADQLFNQVGKARHMYGGDRPIPVVVRTRIGFGNGYGAQHSIDPASLYALFPGWRIVYPSTPFDYVGLLNAAIRADDPVLVIEHQALYATEGPVPEGDRDYLVEPGRARRVREGADLTIVTYGAITLDVVAAAVRLANDHGIEADVIDLRTVDVPGIDLDTVAGSVARTHRLLVVEQAHWISAPGASVVERIQRDRFDDLDAPINRVGSFDVPPPVSRVLEEAVAPSVDDILAAARATVAGRVWTKGRDGLAALGGPR